MKQRNLRSEAAIRRVIKDWGKVFAIAAPVKTDPVISIIDLRELVKKRKPKTGAKKNGGRKTK